MAVPNAVKKKAAEAEELARKTLEQRETAGEGPSVDEILAAAESDEPQTGQGGPDPTPPDTDPKQPNRETHDIEAELKQTRDELQALQERHASLTGKYNKEVPRLLEENRKLKEQNDDLQGQLKAAHEAPPAVSEEDVEAFKKRMGEEFSDEAVESFSQLAEKAARSATPKVDTSQYETRLEALQQKLDQIEATKVDEQLDLMVPGWQSIQRSPEFQKLLGSPVPRTSGRLIYDDLVNDWYKNGEVAPIVRFFNEFLNEQQRQPDKSAASDNAHIEPDSSAGSPPPTPSRSSGEKVWKVSEIEHINQMARNGAFKKRQGELKRLREQIERAAAKGNIEHDMV